ncbi:uncharacterized protein B0H64DRAFT_371570 [Chaetomium fimeti]|uniref:Uncharacterized protein n=1 Tax=Chaetomium fimeti TaxID=1854472 RepID=A0AAE0HMB9_9PEZI|nr:hypothetical protein B0H64DRAFT_371570 [Chaetomium fimeti]
MPSLPWLRTADGVHRLTTATPWAGRGPRVHRPFADEVVWIRVACVGSRTEPLWRVLRAAEPEPLRLLFVLQLHTSRSLHPLSTVSGLCHYTITRLQRGSSSSGYEVCRNQQKHPNLNGLKQHFIDEFR